MQESYSNPYNPEKDPGLQNNEQSTQNTNDVQNDEFTEAMKDMPSDFYEYREQIEREQMQEDENEMTM